MKICISTIVSKVLAKDIVEIKAMELWMNQAH